MRRWYQFRRRRLKARGGYLADDAAQDRSLAHQRLIRELLEAQRREIVRLRNQGERDAREGVTAHPSARLGRDAVLPRWSA